MATSKPMDGGYGWVVVAASFVAHALEYGIMNSVGVLYVIFLEQIDDRKYAIALIATLIAASCFLTGPLSSALINRFGARIVMMVGSIISSLGLICSMWATNIYHLYATFGLLSGFGYGLAYIPTVSVVGLYFNQRRTIAIGIACAGLSLGSFVFPPMIVYFVEQYGWRGAMLLLGAVNLNLCVCSALLRPVPILMHPAQKLADTGATTEPASVLKLFIFKNIDYVCFCVSYPLYAFGNSIVLVHLAAYAGSLGLSENDAAILLSIFGLCNLIGRLSFGFLGQVPFSNTTFLYLFGLATSGLTSVIVPSMTSYAGLVTFAACHGFLAGSYGTLSPQVVINILGVRLLPSGYGYVLVLCAIGYLAGAPTAGWLYESTQLYSSSFYLGGACQILSGLIVCKPWLFPRKTHGVLIAATDEVKVADDVKNGVII